MEQREFAEGNSTGEIPPQTKNGPKSRTARLGKGSTDPRPRSTDSEQKLGHEFGECGWIEEVCDSSGREPRTHTERERMRVRSFTGEDAAGRRHSRSRWWRSVAVAAAAARRDWGLEGTRREERERERSLVWDKFLKFSGGGGGGCRNRGWDWWAPEMERGRRARRGVWRGGGEEVGWFAVWSTTSSTAVHEGKRWRKKKD